MGTRSEKRGDTPSSYSDLDLRAEIARVRLGLTLPRPLKAGARRRMESRLHNLESEQQKRASD
jgi:hypothetical protein